MYPDVNSVWGRFRAEALDELCGEMGGAAGCDVDALGVAIAEGELFEAVDGFAPGADALEGDDFAVGELEDGLDAENGTEHGACAADAATAAEVLEGFEGDVDVDAAHGGLRDVGDVFDGAAGVGDLGGGFDDEGEAAADGVGVDELDADVGGELFAGDGGGVDGAGELGGEVDGDDAVHVLGGGDFAVGVGEDLGGGLAGGGELLVGGETAVEVAGGEVDAVVELFAAEADGEGDDGDAEGFGGFVGEIAGGIGDDADGHNC